MCLAIYIGTDDEMPTIPYDESERRLNTEDLTEDEHILMSIFSKPQIRYIGSDTGCSCGLRYALLDGDRWFPVMDMEPTPFDNCNHLNFVDYVNLNKGGSETIELLACWEYDYIKPIKHSSTIKLSSILDKDFFFNERGFYIVQL